MKHSTIIMLVFESILTFGLTVGLATLLAFWTSGGEIIFAEIFVWALFAAIRIARWLEEHESQSESREGTISNC